ncbi:hypothetical protein SAMN05216417_10636 [Nitrosospira multiformis]|uniref:Uncharacterized protein n=1 Tax=Nitrosospira multiformis TaxID=1231 RepID=A0A1I7GWE8_9PROT|nr:hypothetical protein SAMN05216417_10636 [Nitrosospira multiformis]
MNYKGGTTQSRGFDLVASSPHLMDGTPLDSVITLSTHSILKSLDLSTGGERHKQLHEGIRRFNAGSMQISHTGKKYGGP